MHVQGLRGEKVCTLMEKLEVVLWIQSTVCKGVWVGGEDSKVEMIQGPVGCMKSDVES